MHVLVQNDTPVSAHLTHEEAVRARTDFAQQHGLTLSDDDYEDGVLYLHSDHTYVYLNIREVPSRLKELIAHWTALYELLPGYNHHAGIIEELLGLPSERKDP